MNDIVERPLELSLPDDFAAPRRGSDHLRMPSHLDTRQFHDWHAAVLLRLAKQLGVGNDYYYPLLGAAQKLDMYKDGTPHADAVARAGGA